MTDALSAIEPTGKATVMSLVAEAGVDISDWANYGGKAPAANPKYCYEWAFIQPGEVVVANVWHHALSIEDGDVILRDNLRQRADEYSGLKFGTWKRRAEVFDEAMRTAFVEALPVRAIVQKRRTVPKDKEKSEVSARQLDPVPWAVIDYSKSEGEFVLKRGVAPTGFSDQFSLDSPGTGPAERVNRQGTAFVRDRVVRDEVLARARGYCEYCGKRGFQTDKGAWFLETHHVQPLSEGGTDVTSNVAGLCPNHHREAHHGKNAAAIRAKLEAMLAGG